MSDDLKERLREQAESLDASILNAIRRRRDVEFSALACNEIGLLLTKAADRIAELEAQLARAVEALEGGTRIVRPIADAAYNDNGDLSVSPVFVEAIGCEAVYFWNKRASAFLSELKGEGDGC